MNNLKEYDISGEMWREYEFTDRNGNDTIYHIDKPVILLLRPGGSTHRVVDSTGVCHCTPAPEIYGCVLRWENKSGIDRCQF